MKGGWTRRRRVFDLTMVTGTTRAFGSPLRYIQGPGEFDNLPAYVKPYGTACFLIDAFLFQTLEQRLNAAYEGTGQQFIALSCSGECCDEEVERVKAEARRHGAGVFAGIGGGKTMDVAKLCADSAGLPLVIVPTSASTDAPVSEIAVVYQANGEYIGSRKMRRNAELVLVDSEIVAKAPRRLFIAGIGDALATWLEARACAGSDSPNYIGTGFRRCLAGMAVAQCCGEVLFADGRRALEALDAGAVTEALENVIEANTLLSGLGFLNTGLATAHGIHSGLTALECTHPYLHGEKVAFGVVCQLILENTPEAETDKIMRFMSEIGLPVTLEQLGTEVTPENVRAIAKKTVEGALVHQEPFAVTEDTVYNAIFAADALGRKYRKGQEVQHEKSGSVC